MDWLTEFGNQLSASGFTLKNLLAAGIVLSIIFVLSLREFLVWFLKIGKINQNQKVLLEKIAQLEQRLASSTGKPSNSDQPQFIIQSQEEQKKDEWMNRPLI